MATHNEERQKRIAAGGAAVVAAMTAWFATLKEPKGELTKYRDASGARVTFGDVWLSAGFDEGRWLTSGARVHVTVEGGWLSGRPPWAQLNVRVSLATFTPAWLTERALPVVTARLKALAEQAAQASSEEERKDARTKLLEEVLGGLSGPEAARWYVRPHSYAYDFLTYGDNGSAEVKLHLLEGNDLPTRAQVEAMVAHVHAVKALVEKGTKL